MAKVKTYTQATSVKATDKVLGTDSSNSNESSNLLVSGIADFMELGVTQGIEQDSGLYAFEDTTLYSSVNTSDFSQTLGVSVSPAGISLPEMTVVVATGQAKYVGTITKLFQVAIATNLNTFTGSPTFFRSRVYVNDVYVPNTESVTPVSGLNNSLHSASFPIILNENDYLDFRVAIDTGTVRLANLWTNIFSVASYSTT